MECLFTARQMYRNKVYGVIILHITYSFWGFAPSPSPGLCPWTPLGDFRRPDLMVCHYTPCHKIIDKSPFHIIIQRKLQFCVHICRMKDARMLKATVFGVMEGKTRKGRPCREWTDDITDWSSDAISTEQST